MNPKIYLDYNATTPVRPEVAKAMIPYLSMESDLYGNPSSIHRLGQEARKAVENAREKTAQFLGAEPDEIIFTSCGSESDNLAIQGVAYAAQEKKKGNHIVTSTIEHDTVVQCLNDLQKRGWDVTDVPVDSYGLLDPNDINKAIRPETVLVTVMHANNEIGTIQPISEIGKICREKGIPFHTDAVQSVGKIPIKVDDLNVDLLSLSAHKFYGPKGVGALYVRKGTRLHPLFHGHHERNRRAGTENVPGIVGCGTALELIEKEMPNDPKRIAGLRNRLEKGILEQIPYCKVNGHSTQRLANTSNIGFDFIEGEGVVVALDIEGISVSAGSACASGFSKASHVIRALGIPNNLAQGTVRFSLGRYNSEDDISRALEIIPKVIQKLRSLSPLWREKVSSAKS